MTCPTCKSDRCGNHAACARKKMKNREENIALLKKTISELVEELGQRRGYPLTMWEAEKVTDDFMREVNRKLIEEHN